MLIPTTVTELLHKREQSADVLAVDMCDIYSLNHVDFDEILREYPGMWQQMQSAEDLSSSVS
jgi:CRP-like cAMP-binding protein